MRIVLGSTSTDKAKILKDSLTGKIKDLEIISVNVDSKIPDQPMSEDITIKGAVNRARAAIHAADAEIGIGMEGGVTADSSQVYFLFCACAITDKSGNTYIGVGSKLRIPKEVGDSVKKGKQFGQEIRSYYEFHKNDPEVKEVAKELITRYKSFREAIESAYLSYCKNTPL